MPSVDCTTDARSSACSVTSTSTREEGKGALLVRTRSQEPQRGEGARGNSCLSHPRQERNWTRNGECCVCLSPPPSLPPSRWPSPPPPPIPPSHTIHQPASTWCELRRRIIPTVPPSPCRIYLDDSQPHLFYTLYIRLVELHSFLNTSSTSAAVSNPGKEIYFWFG